MTRPTVRLLAVLLAAACHEGGKDAVDTDALDTEAAPDTLPADTDVADTTVVDTEPADTELPDTGAPGLPDDPAVDTSTPLADAVDGPYHGAWAPRGGTRLVAVHVLHEGATEPAFAWFHDTLLDVDCRFARAEDGRLRCLPEPTHAVSVHPGDCAGDGATVGTTCGDVRYGLTGTTTSSCTVPAYPVVRLEPDPTVTEVGTVDTDGACDASPLPDDSLFARAGRRLSPRRFVRGVARRVPTGGDLDVVVVRAADGAVQPLGFYDVARDAPCEPAHLDGEPHDVLRCAPTTDVVEWPQRYLWSVGYADDTCTTVSAVRGDTCDDLDPNHGLDLDEPSSRALFQQGVRELAGLSGLGDRVRSAHAWVYPGGESECDLVALPASPSPMRELLDPLDPASLPRLGRAGVGEGEVKVHAWVDGEGRALRPVAQQPFVGADGVPCVPVWDEELASVRCLPYWEGVVSWSVSFDGCNHHPVTDATGLEEGDTTVLWPYGEDCFGAWSISRAGLYGPYDVGPRLPPGTILAYPDGDSLGHRWCEGGGQIGAETTLHSVAPSEQPVSSWPELTIDR
jgi:hypothetical protein